jgi:hypothetical protein
MPCWWDRHTFVTKPIGCPIRYFHEQGAEIEKRVREKFKQYNYNTDAIDFFETEGVFCSFPCVKAYIIDKGNKQKYKESLTLLTLLHSKVFGKVLSIPPAGSWKLLKEYGGHLDITSFRNTSGRVEYTETVNVRRPYMFCSSEYIEEHRVNQLKNV